MSGVEFSPGDPVRIAESKRVRRGLWGKEGAVRCWVQPDFYEVAVAGRHLLFRTAELVKLEVTGEGGA